MQYIQCIFQQISIFCCLLWFFFGFKLVQNCPIGCERCEFAQNCKALAVYSDQILSKFTQTLQLCPSSIQTFVQELLCQKVFSDQS